MIYSGLNLCQALLSRVHELYLIYKTTLKLNTINPHFENKQTG